MENKMQVNKSEKINILLAVYHPNPIWFAEQLESIDGQTYPNLSLIIIDDGPDSPIGEEFISTHIKNIPFRYIVHEINLGCNKTFEDLVPLADGEYIAFCDQDDIWHTEKIQQLYEEIKAKDAAIAYCNLSAIDENDKNIADDIRKIRKRDIFLSGKEIARELVLRNSIYGSSLLMKADLARSALPLPVDAPYDHWCSLWAAIYGKVAFLDNALVQHRIHGENLSTPLKGINSKEDYIEQRIKRLQTRLEGFAERFAIEYDEETDSIIRERIQRAQSRTKTLREWADARERWLRGDKSAYTEFSKGKKLSLNAFRFERFMPFLPDIFFKWIIKQL